MHVICALEMEFALITAKSIHFIQNPTKNAQNALLIVQVVA